MANYMRYYLDKEAVKARIKSKRLTNTYIADRLGVTNVTIGRWVNGKHQVKDDYLIDLCTILEVSPRNIIKDEIEDELIKAYKLVMCSLDRLDKSRLYELANNSVRLLKKMENE